MVLVDRFNRPILGLRLSINPSTNCNFRCIFCHREGVSNLQDRMMSVHEIERIVRILTKFGINFVKLTGGEPLLRKDIIDIISRIHNQKVNEISMTTNGTNLDKLAIDLKNAGLNRVNISLHSLDEEKFKLITGVMRLKDTLNAIKMCIDVGITPIKLNMVILKGVNDDEIDDMINFAADMGGGDVVILQLIELVNEGKSSKNYNEFHCDLTQIERSLMERAVKEDIRSTHFRHKYLMPNGVWVEVVKPMHNSNFCMGDNRIRITHDGYFKPCLLRNDNLIDFLTPMRNGASDDELAKLFLRAIELREPFFKPAHSLLYKNVAH
ncbi:MAG: GTP 3',8-cyclase MoaA [Nitrososphaerota archaeon]|nr:GTP 3',8-cyclase MoaA [Nitrososphaerales archaeon]MDW8045303.1 GTP 3',8-cyclase MoaA [Nitrososphaerota archaeon]